MPSILERTSRAAASRDGRTFYPAAVVALTLSMEQLKPLTAAELHPRYGGAVRQFNNTVMVGVQPESVRVVRNSYQQPDSFQVTVDSRALPISPKQIRNCACAVYIWDTRNSPGLPEDAAGNILLEPLVYGIVDDVTSSWQGDGSSITLDGQDYTAIFSQREWDPRKRAPSGYRLDVQLEQLMREGDRGHVMRLRVEPESIRATLPVVGAVARRVNKKGQPVKEKSSWWDVMYRMSQLHGYILFVEGLDVVLALPHVLHQSRAGLLPDAKRRRPVFSFAWGGPRRSIESLEIQRNFGKEATPVIEVRSYDERARRTLVGRYPSRSETAPTGVGTEKDHVKQFTVPGVIDEATLRRYARSYYELVARGEQTLSITTSDLRDSDGNDLLQMRSGDAAVIETNAYHAEAITDLSTEAREKRLRAAGFPDEVARYVAANLEQVDQLRGPWRVKEATIDFDAEQGVTITAEMQEYVVIPNEET